MTLLKNTFRMMVLAAMATAGALCHADQPYHPFAEPMSWDPDFRFFAPVDVQDLEDESARQKANYGWYATYDRMHVGLDRPDIETERGKFDTTWGNRYTFGVMSEEDKGWDFQFLHFSGPNAYTGERAFRTNIPVGTGEIATFPLIGERVPFDPGFGDGTYVALDSLNVATLGSFEINRTWRLKPYMYGGFLEPLVGVRYMDFTDYNVADGLSLFQDAAANNFELFDVSHINNKNRMVLAQIGFRYFKDVGRTRLSTDFKAFAGGNFQTGSVLTQQVLYGYGGGGGGAAGIPTPDIISVPQSTLTNAPGLGDKGVIGMDARVEAQYSLTKAIALRGGLSLLYIGDGIARGSQIQGAGGGFSQTPSFGPSSSFVQQNLVMPGVSFGVTINR